MNLAPHLLAVAGPGPDLAQFARESLWLAQERDLGLTLAIHERSPTWARIMGHETAEDITVFAERWNITVVTWRTLEDLDALIGGWTQRKPKGLILGSRRRWPPDPGLPSAAIVALEHAADARRIEIIPGANQDRGHVQMFGLAWRLDEQRPWYHSYVLSAFAVSLVAILVNVLDRFVPSPSLAILFLTAVVYSATAYGMAAATFTSLLSVGLYDYFFTEPRYEFALTPQIVLLVVPFLLVAGITSNLSGGLRNQATRAQRQAREARALFQLTRDIAVAGDTTPIFRAITLQCSDIFDCNAILLAPFTGAGIDPETVASRAASLQAAYPPHASVTADEIETARWVFTNAAPAGRGTAVSPQLDVAFHPLETSEGIVAVLALKGVAPATVGSPGFRRLIGSICRLAALAVEHTLRKQEVENARVVSQTEGLRSALLTAISHDFGTPLASVIGSASSLLSYGHTYAPEVVQELLTTILEEAERLSRFVKNVLQMNRLESGALIPRMQWADVEDLISTSIDAAHRRLANHEVYSDISDKLPLVNVDFVLMESVLVNLLDNAAKYAPADTDIQITARRLNNDVTIDISDQGRGISSEELGAVFDKFYRARHRDRTVPGTGLGLAICKGIIEAHGGTVEALSEGLGHGTTIRIRLPVKTPDVAVTAEI